MKKSPSFLHSLLAPLCIVLFAGLSLSGCTPSSEPAATVTPRLAHPVNSINSVATETPVAPIPPLPPVAPILPDNGVAPPFMESPLETTPEPWDDAPTDGKGLLDMAERFNTEALRQHDRDLHILRRGNPNLPEIALTFDDGPHPEFLPRLLDKLRELDVHATFFVVGEKVADAPDMAARIVQDGHEIGNHTYHHLNLTTIPLEFVKSEIASNNEMIYKSCGIRPKFFRAPGGRCDEDVFRIARQQRLTSVMWTDDPADFKNPGAEIIEDRLLQRVRPGAVILLHSGIEQTLAMLPDFVAQARRGGYRFVTLSEMAQHLESPSLVATK